MIENAAPKIISQPHCFDHVTASLAHQTSLAGFISQPTLVLESALRAQLSPNPSVLNFFICKQPHLCGSWHWEEFTLNIQKVSCFSDLFLKLLCPCAYGGNQWDFWWCETSAHLSDTPCLHLYSLCSAFVLWFLELHTTVLCWWQSQSRVLLSYPRLKQEWAPDLSNNVLFPTCSFPGRRYLQIPTIPTDLLQLVLSAVPKAWCTPSRGQWHLDNILRHWHGNNPHSIL